MLFEEEKNKEKLFTQVANRKAIRKRPELAFPKKPGSRTGCWQTSTRLDSLAAPSYWCLIFWADRKNAGISSGLLLS